MGDERDQEAEKCIDVAKRALSDGDLQKSIKFLKKSLNFRHSATAENLLKKVEEELAHSTTSPRRPPQSSPSPPPPPSSSTSSPPSSNDASSTSSSTSSNTTNSGPAKRPRASSGASSGSGASSSSASSDAPKRDFTPEQQAAARKINKLTDYYQILGIERTADDAAIKAAYRKMALKFHPDKNHAPEAEEAFKKVSEAYTTLSDGNEREYYNQHGNRGNAQRAARAAYANAGAGAYRDTPMTPEELFNMFFEAQGIRRQQHFHRQRQYQAGEGGQQRGGLMNLAHFLPLILLFLFSFMSGPSSEQTVFSLDKSDVYSIRRTTPAQTPYFVAPSFARNYARDYRALATIEAQADQQYLNKLRELCKAETKEQKMKINEAKKSKADDQPQRLQAAMSMPLPSCDRLSSIGQH